uniref:alkaline phosphatase n=1 Tax=Parastrongyloides trichosuri TaxID=131310 RepID=A0A0N4ZQ06_PARTI
MNFLYFALELYIFTLFRVSICQLKEEYNEKYWNDMSKNIINKKIENFNDNGMNIDKSNKPKNIILFIGDGMGITMTTISRIFKNQQESKEKNITIFDQTQLFYETFPVTGLQRTHTLDLHVGLSCANAVALMSGQKVNGLTLGIKPTVNQSRCDIREDDKLKNLISIKALENGLSVGIVTTARLTHATPGGSYASITDRNYECDADINEEDRSKCKDIASQLLDYPANKFKVMFGGGRTNYIPKSTSDPIDVKIPGRRLDGRHLIEEWKFNNKQYKNVLYTSDELRKLNVSNLKKESQVLGLFAPSHFETYQERSENAKKYQPTLDEMVEKAIEILSKDNDKGYFLMVESGMIDIAEHYNKGYEAMVETVEFSKAIEKGVKMTEEIYKNQNTDNKVYKSKKNQKTDTLVLVTADHAQSVTFNGYPLRTSPVMSMLTEPSNTERLWDDKPLSSVTFTSGPGFVNNWYKPDNLSEGYIRKNLTTEQLQDYKFLTPSSYLSEYNTHDGSDVPVYATGPMSLMFTGEYDNTQIGYMIKYLLCINVKNEMNICDKN